MVTTPPENGLKQKLLGGRYQVLEQLGAGGMGAVYLGRQLGLDRLVAIKVLHPHIDPSPRLLARFKREADAVKTLTHPNTVTIYDFGETEEGDLYLVMEYLKGTTLDRVLRDRGRLPSDMIIRVATQVLKSLIEAHAHGIIHRDIKPGNLMLCEQLGERDLIKVLDFGVARMAEAGAPVTGTGAMVGTPHYMSPEQALGKDVDARSDLYSLGFTLLELATGSHPYKGGTPMQVAMKHAFGGPVRMPAWLVNEDVGRVLVKACAKKPHERYQTAESMLADLHRIPRADSGFLPSTTGRANDSDAVPITSPDEPRPPTTDELLLDPTVAGELESPDSMPQPEPTAPRAPATDLSVTAPQKRGPFDIAVVVFVGAAIVAALIVTERIFDRDDPVVEIPAPPIRQTAPPSAGESEEPEQPEPPDQVAVATEPAPSPPVAIVIQTDPAGARVTLNGEVVCEDTPCQGEAEPRPGWHRLVVEMTGYDPIEEFVELGHDVHRDYELTPANREAERTRESRREREDRRQVERPSEPAADERTPPESVAVETEASTDAVPPSEPDAEVEETSGTEDDERTTGPIAPTNF